MMAAIRLPRSERDLYAAFFWLIRTKSSYSISVKELARTAGVNRSTFYRHFDNMPQFLDRVSSYYVNALMDACGSAEVRPGRRDYYIKWYRHFFMYRQEYRLLLSGNGVIGFRKKLIDNGIAVYRRKLLGKNSLDTGIDARTLSVYIVSAHIGLTECWLNGGCKESPEEMARRLTVLSIDGAFRAAGVGRGMEFPA